MPQSSYYLYHGVSIPEKFQAAVESFIRNEAKPGRRLESLKGDKSIFSIRLSRKARLLFTHFQGRILILDVLPNHEYPKSFKRWKQLTGANIIERDLNTFENGAQAGPSSVLLDYQYVHLFHAAFVLLSEEQESVVEGQGHRTRLCIGHAGTGKTLVAARILANRVLSGDRPEKPFAFVCQSPRLARTMAEQFFNEFGPLENFHFLAYDEWIAQVSGCAPVLGFEHFKSWLNTHYKKHKRDLDRNKVSEEQLYQELRILSGLKIKEDYLSLGKKQSSIPKDNPKLRHQILEAYFAYERCLDEAQEKNQEINPHFYQSHVEGIYEHVVIDEAQDLSGAQLWNLFKAVLLASVTAFMDTYQSLQDQLSKQNLFHVLAREFGSVLTLQYFTHPYRCAPRIERVADCIREVTRIATGGEHEKRVQTMTAEPAQDNGFVEIHPPSDFKASDFYKNTDFSQHANIAIVTSQAHLEEAKYLFNTPFVFTPEQIKGHQFSCIIAYRCMDKAFSRTLDGILKDTSRKYSSQNRPKEGHSHPQYGPPLHELLVAFTRAVNKLMIVEDDNQLIQFIKTRLDLEQRTGLQEEPGEASVSMPVSSQEDWLNAAQRLLKENGRCLQVREALKEAGIRSNEEVDAFIERHDPVRIEHEKTVSGISHNVGAEGSSSGQLPSVNTASNQASSSQETIKPKRRKNGKNGKRGKSGKKGKTNQANLQLAQLHLAEKPRELSRQEKRKLARQQNKGGRQKQTRETRRSLSPFHLPPPARDFRTIFSETIAPANYAKQIIEELTTQGRSDRFVEMARAKEHFQLTTFTAFGQLPIEAISEQQWGEQLQERQSDGKMVVEYFFDSQVQLNRTPLELSSGMTFLTRLFEVYPAVAKQIPIEIWKGAIHKELTAAQRHFFLRCLMSTQEGQAQLNTLFSEQQALFEDFFLGAWKQVNRLGESQVLSPVTSFDLLSKFREGKQLLRHLFEKDERLVSQIERDDWLTMKSPLLWRLSRDTEGLALLNVLIDKHPEVIKQMPFQVWGLIETVPTDEKTMPVKHSALYYFLKTEYGRETFCWLSEVNETLFTKITAGIWQAPAPYLCDQSPLDFLCVVGDARVLALLGRYHPKLLELEHIPLEVWTCAIHKAQTAAQRHFFLRCLMGTQEGQSQLNTLFSEQQALFEGFFLGAWKQINGLGQPQVLSSVTSFDLLSRFREGKQLLRHLFETDERLASQIEMDDWLTVQPPIFSRLSEDEDGLALLNVLIGKHPEVIKQMPFQVWGLTEMVPSDEKAIAVKHSALYSFLKTEYGRETLCGLSEVNDALFTKYKARFWQIPTSYLGDQAPLDFLRTVGDERVLALLGRYHLKLLEQENIPPEFHRSLTDRASVSIFQPHEEPQPLPQSNKDPDQPICLRV